MASPLMKKLKYWTRSRPLLFKLTAPIYFAIFQFNQKKKWRGLQKTEQIKLELGSGPKKGVNGWTCIDLSGADINWNLKKGIPLKDNSADYIYSSHLLEHIPYRELRDFLEECRRVLKPRGRFSVCVPNAGITIRQYCSGKSQSIKDMPEWAEVNTGSRLDILNYVAYMGGEHHYMFDEENLVKTLQVAGFRRVCLRKFEPGLDLVERHHESIYAVAFK